MVNHDYVRRGIVRQEACTEKLHDDLIHRASFFILSSCCSFEIQVIKSFSRRESYAAELKFWNKKKKKRIKITEVAESFREMFLRHRYDLIGANCDAEFSSRFHFRYRGIIARVTNRKKSWGHPWTLMTSRIER